MENDRIGKRVYVGECAGSRSVDREDRYREGLLEEERFGSQTSKENGA